MNPGQGHSIVAVTPDFGNIESSPRNAFEPSELSPTNIF